MNFRSNSHIKSFVIVVVCIIATLHECTGACTKCTSCLSGVLNIPAASSSTIDQGKCPSKTTLEYNLVQLIELMFRKSGLSRKSPCRRVCVPCRQKILQTCNKCSFNPDNNNNCESFNINPKGLKRPCGRMYNGLFFESATAYNNAMHSDYTHIVSEMSVSADTDDSIKAQASSNVKASARAASGSKNSSCDGSCKVDMKTINYTTPILDREGETWYPVWYKTGSAVCHQYYMEAKCHRHSSCYILRNSIRTFVFTTIEPDEVWGHSNHTFYIDKSDGMDSNITFIKIALPGYCEN